MTGRPVENQQRKCAPDHHPDFGVPDFRAAVLGVGSMKQALLVLLMVLFTLIGGLRASRSRVCTCRFRLP
jgi:hypothetical protein